MMAITNSFRNAVATGDIRGIRIMMKDSLLVDPTFTEFAEMGSLTQSILGLYDPHDGREFESDKSAWNDDYMNKLMVQVVGNFSHERITHLEDVVRYLRPVATRPQTSVSSDEYARRKSSNRPEHTPSLSYHEQKRQDERNGRIIHRSKKIAVSAAAGGVAGGAVAAVAGSSLIVGAALGAVVVGTVVAIVTSEGQ